MNQPQNPCLCHSCTQSRRSQFDRASDIIDPAWNGQLQIQHLDDKINRAFNAIEQLEKTVAGLKPVEKKE
jgi:hypothetical protein